MPRSEMRVGAVVVDCHNPEALSAYWCHLLGLRLVQTDHRWHDTEPAVPGGPKLAFQRVPEPRVQKNHLHIDLHTDQLEAAVESALFDGAQRRGDIVVKEGERFQVMADPEGNEFCIIEFARRVPDPGPSP